MSRTPWTPLRAWSTIGCGTSILTAAGSLAASAAYTGSPDTTDLFWISVAAAIISGSWSAAAYVRDSTTELQRCIQDYGDRREAAGHVSATRLMSRTLTPVD